MKKILIFILILDVINSFAQDSDTVNVIDNRTKPLFENFRDSINNFWFESMDFNYYDSKWNTIGIQYDFLNYTFGLVMSNGYDEMPLIHFEDFSEKFVYKVNVQTNFNKDYSFGFSFAWKRPIILLNLASIEYLQHDLSSKNVHYKNINISAKRYIKDIEVIVKLGY
jgi:hypothetical protein